MDDKNARRDPHGPTSVSHDLCLVARLLFEAGGAGMAVADHDGECDSILASHAMCASLASMEALGLLNVDTEVEELWHRLAPNSKDFFGLVVEAESVLAKRPIDQWPNGTSHLVLAVCDLIGDMRRGGFGPRAPWGDGPS